MMKFLSTLLFFCYSLCTYSQVFEAHAAHAEVKGSATVSSYTGTSEKLDGRLNIETKEVNFKIPLESIDTGIKLRNKHMLETLEASKHPDAKFTGKLVDEFDSQKHEAQKVKVSGEFTIHGQSKPLELSVTLTPGEKGIEFIANWDINITDYGMERPKKALNKVNDKHSLSIKGILSPAK